MNAVFMKTIYYITTFRTQGYPITNELLSVTILSDSSMEGDAYSTMCLCLGLKEGMELIEATEGLEALFITDDMKLHYSSGFPKN